MRLTFIYIALDKYNITVGRILWISGIAFFFGKSFQALCVCVCVYSVTQLCPTLCDPTDCSLPGSSVHRISQSRIQKWVAISFSRGSSRPRDQNQSLTLQDDTLPSEPLGKLLDEIMIKMYHFIIACSALE